MSKFSGDPAKATFKQSKFDSAFPNRKGLLGKYHYAGVKVGDPTVSIGNVGTYEWGVNHSKFTFKNLDNGNASVVARNRADGCQSVLISKKMDKGCTASFKIDTHKGGNRNYVIGMDGKMMGFNSNIKVHPTRLLDGGKSDKPDIKCSTIFDVPAVNGLSLVMDAKAKLQGSTFCNANAGFVFKGIDNACIGVSASHKKDITCDVAYNLKDMNLDVGALVAFSADSKKLSWVAGCGFKQGKDQTHVKINHDMQLAVQHKKNLSDNFSVTLGSLTSVSNPQSLFNNVGLKLNFKA